jgi:folylpolyglutamate synthase/dihydropteroate synthase
MSSERALPASALAAAWRNAADRVNGQAVEAIDDWSDALATAMDAARTDGGPLVVAGSLFLVGDVRGRLVSAQPAA